MAISDVRCSHPAYARRDETAVGQALRRAETRALHAGHRWTEPRRRTYELLLQEGAPLKAYDLIERFGGERTTKPPTVYRALEFLEQVGLVHRIASLNAYVVCDSDNPGHPAAFLICDCCGAAEEFEPGPIRAARVAARVSGFIPRAIALEVRGHCANCLPSTAF